MFDWTKYIKRFWPAITLVFALALIVDGTISSLETCHPPNSTGNGQNSDKDCTALQGPLISLIIGTGDFVGDHDKGIVAAFTAILALSTIGLWNTTIGLYSSGEKQIKSSRQIAAIQALQGRQQFKFAKETADRQALEIHEQLRLTRENIEFARLEFNATHRPRLVVREAHMLIPTGRAPTAGVRFIVANTGEGVADVVESFVILEFNELAILLPLQPPEHSNSIGPIRIEPGQGVEGEFGSTVNFPQYTNEQNRHLNHPGEPTPKIWLRGFIVYLDNNRIRRRMAFCRGYDFKAKRFRAGDDPNYEYSD
jgi:hypothetical protein